MRAGKGSSDAYMEDWRRDRSPCSGELQGVVDNAAAELVNGFNDTYLEALVKAKGIAANVSEDLRTANQNSPAASSQTPDNPSGDTSAEKNPL